MIIKAYEYEKIKSVSTKIFLFYGENNGYKNLIKLSSRSFLLPTKHIITLFPLSAWTILIHWETFSKDYLHVIS